MNKQQINDINKRLEEAFKNDKSHVKKMSENES
jgi:hypothetical protein